MRRRGSGAVDRETMTGWARRLRDVRRSVSPNSGVEPDPVAFQTGVYYLCVDIGSYGLGLEDLEPYME